MTARDADTQALIEPEIATALEVPAWAVAQDALVTDIACLTGNGDGPADDACAGHRWAARWNDSVGATVGVTVPVN